jgi:multidrug transporter EmrE-like cation transporter
VTCLSWTGFIGTAIVYKAIFLAKDKRSKSTEVMKEHFLSQLGSKHNLIHQVLRTANWFLYIWLTILIGQYARLACMNPGIIYACLSATIIFNSIWGFLVFGEKITIKMSIGILVVIASVFWISVARNSNLDYEITIDGEVVTEDQVLKNRILGVIVTIIASIVSSMRPI